MPQQPVMGTQQQTVMGMPSAVTQPQVQTQKVQLASGSTAGNNNSALTNLLGGQRQRHLEQQQPQRKLHFQQQPHRQPQQQLQQSLMCYVWDKM